MTCAPASSSARAQRRLRSSSKRAISSTTAVTCLPWSAARMSAATIGESLPGAVQRLLDGEHVRVVGGLLDERHHRVERVVRMVEEDVPRVERIEDAARRAFRRAPGRASARVAQPLEARQVDDAPERAQVEEARHAVDVRRPRRRRARRAATPGRSLAPASTSSRTTSLFRRSPQLLLDGLDVRLPAFVVELELGVSREPERGRLEDGLPGEQHREMPARMRSSSKTNVTPSPPATRTRRGRTDGTCTTASPLAPDLRPGWRRGRSTRG